MDDPPDVGNLDPELWATENFPSTDESLPMLVAFMGVGALLLFIFGGFPALCAFLFGKLWSVWILGAILAIAIVIVIVMGAIVGCQKVFLDLVVPLILIAVCLWAAVFSGCSLAFQLLGW